MSTPSQPPDDQPQPTFPGFKMERGAPERSDSVYEERDPARATRGVSPILIALGVAIVVIVILLLLL
jgi:hypothetical protein